MVGQKLEGMVLDCAGAGIGGNNGDGAALLTSLPSELSAQYLRQGHRLGQRQVRRVQCLGQGQVVYT